MPRPAKSREPRSQTSLRPSRDDHGASLDQPISHYKVLDIHEDADATEIHAAYKRRALSTHPDKGGCVSDFQKVLEAFQTLSDTMQRCIYDQQLREAQPLSRSHCHQTKASSHLHVFNRKLAQLLQKMSAACRRRTILYRLSNSQRTSLEEHLRDEKAKSSQTKTTSSDAELCEVKRRTGICCSTRSGGYYAKVFVHSFGLQGAARKDLGEAVADHIGLTRIANHLRSTYFGLSADQRRAPSESDPALPLGLIASAQVFFYCRHFIGHRHLQLNFKTLTEGLEAWEAMQRARGTVLFSGQGVTEAYSPGAAMEQWRRIKEAYLRFACRRHSSRVTIERQLLSWEKQYSPVRMERECKLWRRQQREKRVEKQLDLNRDASDAFLARCVDRLLKYQSELSKSVQSALKQQCGRKRMHRELSDVTVSNRRLKPARLS